MSNTDETPSQPKIDVNALAKLLDEKLGEQETRLLDGFRRVVRDERDKTHSLVYEIATWISGKFRNKP